MSLNLLAILGVVFLLGFSILVHEFGHFITAKLFRVPVHKFAIGFGKKIWGFKFGMTEYVLNWIPFGGYVGMGYGDNPPPGETAAAAADDRRPQPATEQQSQSVPTATASAAATDSATRQPNTDVVRDTTGDDPLGDLAILRGKPLYAKLIIFAAGCFMNYLTAVVIFSLLLYAGEIKEKPIASQLGYIPPASQLSAAGLREGQQITAVNAEPVKTWQEIEEQLVKTLQDQPDQPLILTVMDGAAASSREAQLPSLRALEQALELRYLEMPLEAFVSIAPYGPADKAGMEHGDRIVAINGQPIRYFTQIMEIVEPALGQELEVVYQRGDERRTVRIKPERSADLAHDRAIIGISDYLPDSMYETIEHGLAESFALGWRVANFYTVQIPYLTVKVFSKGLRAIRKNVGGVLMIGHQTYELAKEGLRQYLRIFALINIMLMVMNLLPIPLLDGGHIVIALIESTIRRPIPERVLMPVFNTFFILLISLVVLITFNDIITIFF